MKNNGNTFDTKRHNWGLILAKVFCLRHTTRLPKQVANCVFFMP